MVSAKRSLKQRLRMAAIITLAVLAVLTGGFLWYVSNYQPEMAEYFIPGKDLVLYDSVDDLIQKIDYYLSHEEERLQIAKNGYEKVKRYHTYDTRLTEILNTVISD